ncbi:hypothetical protein [Amycolatopsis magusensis]|uniref:hypothetical protein n=1 Tax=Amycolatopsis magusensis TaxID=882444 RepID=UPI003C2BE8AF
MPMSFLPDLPEKLVKRLFNLDHGEHIDKHCRKCDKITDQVAVSYGDMPTLRGNELERLIGRVIDIVPFAPVVGGKPTVCGCGTVNR